MKKVFLSVLALFCVLLSGCSCDKFDVDTYNASVRNYNNASGISYDLVIITSDEGSSIKYQENLSNVFEFTPTRDVTNYSSVYKKYEITTSNSGIDSAPVLVYTMHRYYVGETNSFYTKEKTTIENTSKETISYEEKYSLTNEKDNKNNLVPVFNEEDVRNFDIEKDGKNGDSVATFTASVPVYIPSDNEVTTYTVRMNDKSYFTTIEFTIVNGTSTSTYKYTFYSYNSESVVQFPENFSDY